jgi:hypothetical protein
VQLNYRYDNNNSKDVTGRSEDIKKAMMASNTAEDAMVLNGSDGKSAHTLKDIGSREWVKNINNCGLYSIRSGYKNPCKDML